MSNITELAAIVVAASAIYTDGKQIVQNGAKVWEDIPPVVDLIRKARPAIIGLKDAYPELVALDDAGRTELGNEVQMQLADDGIIVKNGAAVVSAILMIANGGIDLGEALA